MANKMQIKRGNKANLPTLSDGEFGFCKDTNELFIGNGGANRAITGTGITSGTNYLKFDDGTMIEWGSKTFTPVNIGAAWGSLYTSGDLSMDDFPQAFIAVPIVSINVNRTAGSPFFICKVNPATKTNPGTYQVCSAVGGAGASELYMDYMAIGRWKA